MLQKRAVRIISFAEREVPSGPIFAELKLLKFFDLVQFLNIVLIHNILNEQIPIDVHNTFCLERYSGSDITRGLPRGTIKTPFVKTKRYGDCSVKCQAIRRWNTFQQSFLSLNLADYDLTKFKDYITTYNL